MGEGQTQRVIPLSPPIVEGSMSAQAEAPSDTRWDTLEQLGFQCYQTQAKAKTTEQDA